MNNLKTNGSGCKDLTAYEAVNSAAKTQSDLEKRMNDEITLKKICYLQVCREDEDTFLALLARNGYFVRRLCSGRIMICQNSGGDIQKVESEA